MTVEFEKVSIYRGNGTRNIYEMQSIAKTEMVPIGINKYNTMVLDNKYLIITLRGDSAKSDVAKLERILNSKDGFVFVSNNICDVFPEACQRNVRGYNYAEENRQDRRANNRCKGRKITIEINIS